jgi:hypothetical protein
MGIFRQCNICEVTHASDICLNKRISMMSGPVGSTPLKTNDRPHKHFFSAFPHPRSFSRAVFENISEYTSVNIFSPRLETCQLHNSLVCFATVTVLKNISHFQYESDTSHKCSLIC